MSLFRPDNLPPLPFSGSQLVSLVVLLVVLGRRYKLTLMGGQALSNTLEYLRPTGGCLPGVSFAASKSAAYLTGGIESEVSERLLHPVLSRWRSCCGKPGGA